MPSTLLLIHSPLGPPNSWEKVAAKLRPGYEVVIASLSDALAGPEPYWRRQVELSAAAINERASTQPVTLIGHSGAGGLLALIGQGLPRAVAGYVFVDAGLPREGSWMSGLPDELAQHMHAIAHDGLLPRWSEWWDDEELANELPDARQREQLKKGEPQVPLALLEELRPAVSGWPDAPCGYLRLSSGYDHEAAQAASLGWPVEMMQSTHLAILTEPTAVADRIRVLLSRLEMA